MQWFINFHLFISDIAAAFVQLSKENERRDLAITSTALGLVTLTPSGDMLSLAIEAVTLATTPHGRQGDSVTLT